MHTFKGTADAIEDARRLPSKVTAGVNGRSVAEESSRAASGRWRHVAIFIFAAAVVCLTGVTMPASAASVWNTYFNATATTGVQKWGVVGNISGGSSQATIGEIGNSYIRTWNVFGEKVHESVGYNSNRATMTHTIRFDAKSACIWRVNNPGASGSPTLPLICRDLRNY